MQRIFTFLVSVICFVIIFVGYFSWNQKIGETVNESSYENIAQNTDPSYSGKSEEQNDSLSFDELKQSVSNLPDAIQQIFKEAYVNGGKVNIVLVGSPSMGFEENGWSVTFKNELQNFYGTDFINVFIHEFDGTSTEFIESEQPEQIVNEDPNIILLEVFTFKDNLGLIPENVSHNNLQMFIEQVQEEIQEVEFIIQPPNPIHKSINYPIQIEELKHFAESRGISYFNHWDHWPDPNSEEIQAYLNNESLPNEKGHELWAKAIVDYFIRK